MQVDFYILPDRSEDHLLVYACRLTEKAYNLGHKVYLHAASAAQARRLDELLWTFRDGSFVPHALCPPPPHDLSPVHIGWGENALTEGDVFIHLTAAPELPMAAEKFGRISELVNQEASILHASRQRFLRYRERNLEPKVHKIERP